MASLEDRNKKTIVSETVADGKAVIDTSVPDFTVAIRRDPENKKLKNQSKNGKKAVFDGTRLESDI